MVRFLPLARTQSNIDTKEVVMDAGYIKKNNQLGINSGTARGRLVKDLLFKFVVDSGIKCFRCGGDLDRESFSIDHKIPWLDSHNPTELFFNLDNISYSHKGCNYRDARRPHKKYTSPEEQQREVEKRRRGRRIYNREYRRRYYVENHA